MNRAIILSVLLPVTALLGACGGGGGGGGYGGNPPPPPTFTIGGTVSGLTGSGLKLQLNGGADMAVAANGAFTFPGSLGGAASYTVAISAQPSIPAQTCSVENATGTVGSSNITNVNVTCASKVSRFAYAVNQGDNTISMYTVEAASGQLRPNGYVLAGTNPTSMAVTPSGKFAYVSSNTTNDIKTFSIDANTGFLTPAGSPVAAGQAPRLVVVDPTGKFAYTSNLISGDVSMYTIDASSGALTSVGAAVASGDTPNNLAFDPAGKHLYVTNSGARGTSGLSVYSVNATTGALTPVPGSPFMTEELPQAVVVDPTGRFAYVANFASGSISAYTLDASSGVPTPNGAALKATTALNTLTSVNLDPSGKFAYAIDGRGNRVIPFSVDASTGALTALGSPQPTGTGPVSIKFDASGKFAYVNNSSLFSASISSFTVASNGALTPLGTVRARDSTLGLTILDGGAAIKHTAKFAYSANGGNTVSAFGIDDTTGALTAAGSAVPTGTTPAAIAADLRGRFLYTANAGGDDVSGFTVNPLTGALVSTGARTTAGTQPFGITVDPSGRFAYVANAGSKTVYAYGIDQTTGALTFASQALTENEPRSVVIDPTGRFAYVTDRGSVAVSGYTIDATTGKLSPTIVATTLVGLAPLGAAIDPSGRFLYVANSGSNSLSAFSIEPQFGTLFPIGSMLPLGDAPGTISIEPSGRFVYVGTPSGLFVYSINATTGALTLLPQSPVPAGSRPGFSIVASGKFGYVPNVTTIGVSGMTLDATTGVPTLMSAPFGAGISSLDLTTISVLE